MRRLVWSKAALAEIDDAIAYIARDNYSAAIELLDRIDATAQLLAETPIGRPGRVHDTFEKPVSGSPYIIAYHLGENTLTILRVIHGRRNWPEDAWPER